MMTHSVCTAFRERSIAEQYVAGTLADAETEAFERHLVGCRDCQDEVRFGSVVRRAATTVRGSPGIAAAPIRRRRWLIVGAALAAGIVAMVALQRVRSAAVRALGAMSTLPGYGGIEVRSAERSGDSLFLEGMALYRAGRLRDAIRVLGEARADGADSVPTTFFIGVSYLSLDRTHDARRELSALLKLGESPYLAEAHYYQAKALLRRAATDSALAHLDAAAAVATPFGITARALKDSVLEARR